MSDEPFYLPPQPEPTTELDQIIARAWRRAPRQVPPSPTAGLMAATGAERARRARDKQRGGPPRALEPCGTTAAAKRHRKAGEDLCGPCRAAEREANREKQARFRSSKKAAAP